MTAPKPYRCSECGHRFASQRALDAHQRDAHFHVSKTALDDHLRDSFNALFGPPRDAK